MRLLALALLFAAPAAQAQKAPVQASLMAPGWRVADPDRPLKFHATALGLVLRDGAPGRAPPIVPGNGFAKVLMRVPDLAGVVTRMKAAGYPVGTIHRSKRGPSVLMIADPDGYTYEPVDSGASHG